jgi:hypothetical protein
MTKLSPLGITLALAGVALNYKTIYQYTTARQITAHWSYVACGAFFILTGAVFYLLGVLGRIMRALNDTLNKKDPG